VANPNERVAQACSLAAENLAEYHGGGSALIEQVVEAPR
jgi:hypothetical protein